MVFRRGSCSSFERATTERGIGLRSASAAWLRCRRTWCAACRRCAGRGRIAWGNSCPRRRDRRWCRSVRPRDRKGSCASCLRSKMLTSSAAMATVASAARRDYQRAACVATEVPAFRVSVMIASYENSVMGNRGGRLGVADRGVAARALQVLRPCRERRCRRWRR